MTGSVKGKSGQPLELLGYKIPQMYNCLIIDGLEFAFDRSFVRTNAAKKIGEEIPNMKQANPSGAKFFVYGHTDAVGSALYNKSLSDRRALAVFAFLTHDADQWLALHRHEKWGRWEVALAASMLPTPPPVRLLVDKESKILDVPGLTQLYLDYMKVFHATPLDAGVDFCSGTAYAGCSEFNPRIAASTNTNRTIRNRENEPNRRTVVFSLEEKAAMPCKHDALPPFVGAAAMRPCQTFRYRPPDSGRHLFTCKFYDMLIAYGQCPKETEPPAQTPPPPSTGKSIDVIMGFPEAKQVQQMRKNQKTDPLIWTKTYEAKEVNWGGHVVSVLKPELESLDSERKLQKIKGKPKKPTHLVKLKVSGPNHLSKFVLEARVVDVTTQEVLLTREVAAPYCWGHQGWYYKSGEAVQRKLFEKDVPPPGREVEFLHKGSIGLNHYEEDMWLLLRIQKSPTWREFGNITEHVEEIMLQKGYKILRKGKVYKEPQP